MPRIFRPAMLPASLSRVTWSLSSLVSPRGSPLCFILGDPSVKSRLSCIRFTGKALKPLMNPRKKVDLKLIIVGALGVGKTSLLHQYVHKTFFEEYQTTLGASILSKIIILDDTTLKLQIWDTGGQERFRSMVSTFYKGSDGCILAFDVTDPESFEALDIWRDDVLAKIIPMEQSYPMVVLGNKIDLEDRKVSQEVVHGWCKEKDMPYFEVSAKNDINVVQAFEVLASRALLRSWIHNSCS
ncbi:ras-related protein Rab-7b isoform X2 [Mus musculus]|uniref:ras-related protein Rab-7b isoform X2 n=1 Tax=Mus musculus TaxID=10090 RepID=UPI001677D3FD|nr:ras-related protein Rab-7b isoform X2 [Mus musculus]